MVNKAHPLYNEYREKCLKLGDEIFGKIDALPKGYSGQDRYETTMLYTELSERLKKLKQEYKEIFIKEDDESTDK